MLRHFLMPKLLLATLGSLGDLHPYLALGLELKRRGHTVTIATSGVHAPRVAACGLNFAPVRPDESDFLRDSGTMEQLMDQRRGSEAIMKLIILPWLRPMFDDLSVATRGQDLLLSHPLTLPIRLIAESRGIPWVSSFLAPISLLSAHDPPVLPPLPLLRHFRWLGPGFHRALFGLGRRVMRPWFKGWDALRAELGLPAVAGNPILEEQHAPRLALALYSPLFGPKPPDAPPQTVVTGFPFFDPPGGQTLAPELEDFVAAGEPPVVFTLGSSAVRTAGGFYQRARAAVREAGCRAVFLIGEDERNALTDLDERCLAVSFADHALLFPRGGLIVHQGGVGTTAQALRAGVPSLIVPFAHDQFDNAARVERLGAGRVGSHRASAAKFARQLRALLADKPMRARAVEVGAQICAERGVEAACDAFLRMQ